MKCWNLIFVLLSAATAALSADYYVDVLRPDDSGAATNWLTAKKTIQAAVDLAGDGDTVWVTNGVYETGGAITPGYVLSNRVCITKAMTLRSVNGPDATIIKGAVGTNGGNDTDSMRAVFMSSGSQLIGFSVTEGTTIPSGGNYIYDRSGGGVWMNAGCVVSNCIVSSNSAASYAGGVYMLNASIDDSVIDGNWANVAGGLSGRSGSEGIACGCVFKNNHSIQYAGGVYEMTLNNCLVMENGAGTSGGGAKYCDLNNCTVVMNSASTGGGTDSCIVQNSIVWGNTGGDIYYGTARYSCASNIVHGENGCITNIPAFTGVDDFRLSPTSPCINCATNEYAVGAVDFAGNPRIIDTTVDMGAYEFYNESDDFDGDGIANQWEADYYGNITNAVAGMMCANGESTLLETYIAGLEPNDPDSMFSLQVDIATQFGNILHWPSASGREYVVYCSTNLQDGFFSLVEHLESDSGTYIDSIYEYTGPRYYKIDVQVDEDPSDNVILPAPIL